MKGQQIALLAGAAAVLLILTSAKSASGPVDLSSLQGSFDADKIQRLQNVENALSGFGLTTEQMKYLLSQILQETGLFTDVWNQHATDDLNNYAGISPGGTLKAYPDLNSFATDYIRVLSLPNSYPILAVSIDDFNNRLKANGYYTDSSGTYGANLDYYYNLLS